MFTTGLLIKVKTKPRCPAIGKQINMYTYYGVLFGGKKEQDIKAYKTMDKS